jgi:hypothetical protein
MSLPICEDDSVFDIQIKSICVYKSNNVSENGRQVSYFITKKKNQPVSRSFYIEYWRKESQFLIEICFVIFF